MDPQVEWLALVPEVGPLGQDLLIGQLALGHELGLLALETQQATKPPTENGTLIKI